MVRSPEKLERRQSFSLYLLLLFLFSLSLLFLPPVWPNMFKWECPPLPHVNLLFVPLDFSYSLIHNFGFPSYQVVTHVTHGPHLGSCLTCSPFDMWLNVSHPNKCQVSLVTLHASKNVKFRLSWNSMKFDMVVRFARQIQW